MNVTIQTIQRSTKQEQKGFWATTIKGKTIACIHKLTTGGYGVSLDMSEHQTFMKALGHIATLLNAVKPVQKVNKALCVAALSLASFFTVNPATQAAEHTPTEQKQILSTATELGKTGAVNALFTLELYTKSLTIKKSDDIDNVKNQNRTALQNYVTSSVNAGLKKSEECQSIAMGIANEVATSEVAVLPQFKVDKTYHALTEDFALNVGAYAMSFCKLQESK